MAANRTEVLLEPVIALEDSAVKLHRAYSDWLQATGRFGARGEDGLYANLCTFRNSCRAVAWRVRAREVPQLYWAQVEAIVDSLEVLGRCRDCENMDPALRELMRHACAMVQSFRGAYDAVVASEVVTGAVVAAPPTAKNPPRVGPLRLLPNRFDIMSFLENRWASN